MKAKPEVISTPAKDAGASVDKTDPPPQQDATLTNAEAEQEAGATFANTKQHVADRQNSPDGVQRFANTKHNIALINDPKNGPRFTLTKKESGLIEQPGAPSTPSATDKTEPNQAPTVIDEAKTDVNETKADQKAGDPRPAPASTTTKPETQTAAGHVGPRSEEPEPPTPRPRGPLGVPPAAEPPSKVPVDSSKTFVGPNGTFYDEAWRWMDWRGTKRSWNWPAALTFGHWFAYRRLYWHAGAYIGWLMALAAAAVSNVHVGLVAGLLILTLGLTGLYGNTLYFLVFRRAVAHVTEKGEGSYDELKVQLAKAGGVNPKAPWFMAGLTIIGIGAALAAVFYGRGGFTINIWPF